MMSSEEFLKKFFLSATLRYAPHDDFHRGGIILRVLLYTTNPWKTSRKSMKGGNYRTRIIPLLTSMKSGISLKFKLIFDNFSTNSQPYAKMI
jgi:hypothetical protein